MPITDHVNLAHSGKVETAGSSNTKLQISPLMLCLVEGSHCVQVTLEERTRERPLLERAGHTNLWAHARTTTTLNILSSANILFPLKLPPPPLILAFINGSWLQQSLLCYLIKG